jgi:Periplasmic copper-binding protein (NosD)
VLRARRPLRFAVLPVTATVLAAWGSSAAAQPVECGQVITEDTKLDSDPECSFPFETALTIGGDGVTLDLNGHTVRFDASIGTGIDNQGGYDRVTIRDGAVEGFEAAVRLEGASGNRLVNLRVRTAPNAAVVLAGSTGNVIRNSEFFSINQGLILTEGSDRNLVVGTSLRAGGGEGLIISDSGGNRIARNVFPFDIFGAVRVSGSQNEIVRNQVADTILEPGITVREGSDNLILGNNVSTGPAIFRTASASKRQRPTPLSAATSPPVTATTG